MAGGASRKGSAFDLAIIDTLDLGATRAAGAWNADTATATSETNAIFFNREIRCPLLKVSTLAPRCGASRTRGRAERAGDQED